MFNNPKNLIEAVQNGDFSSVAHFLKTPGVNVNVTADSDDRMMLDDDAVGDRQGAPVIILAAKEGYSGIVGLLIKSGADIYKTDNLNYTAWYYAALNGNRESLQYLLDAGVNINSKDKQGRTALYVASESGNVLAVQFLLTKGADINITDNNGVVVEQIAKHNAKIMKIFSDYRAPPLSDINSTIVNNLKTEIWSLSRQAAEYQRQNNLNIIRFK